MIQATQKTRAYPDDVTAYKIQDNSVSLKMNPRSYATVHESVPNANLLYNIIIYSEDTLLKSNECLFNQENDEIVCPINEFRSKNLSFVIQTILSRTLLTTAREKRDVIDQSPVMFIPDFD